MKLLQMLSIQEEELIPTPIRKAFETAREAAHVMPRSEVVAVLRQSLGDDWQTKFSKFQEAPFAAASIGQVHRAMNSAGEVAYP